MRHPPKLLRLQFKKCNGVISEAGRSRGVTFLAAVLAGWPAGFQRLQVELEDALLSYYWQSFGLLLTCIEKKPYRFPASYYFDASMASDG
eukprot:scaffold23479_cov143-Cylindrotheca_fusiformis.AAC.2